VLREAGYELQEQPTRPHPDKIRRFEREAEAVAAQARISLTAAGERVALEVIRHHRLLELSLAETLGLSVDAVHDEADRLEHVISEELEARIDKALGFPTHDPHGDPIPDANLEWPSRPSDRRTRPRAASDTPRG